MTGETPVEVSDETKKKSPETVPEQKAKSPSSPSRHQDGRASPNKGTSPAPASSPIGGSRSHVPPIITNSVPNRPPSTTSVHSNGSGGHRSTTATSRRGGRTRSRSPPLMTQRPASAGPGPEPYGGPEDRRAPPSPANPSAAAAAAAAAAKSMTRAPQPPPSSWYDSPDARDRDYRRSRYHGRYYEGGPPPPTHRWPEEGGPGRPPSRNRYPPRRPVEEDHYGYREAYSSYRGRGTRGEPYPHPHASRYEEESSRRDPMADYYGRPPSPGFEHGEHMYRRRPREDPYHGHSKDPESARTEVGGAASVKRTTRVIGGPTPIHMPRAGEPSSRSSRGGSKADSIFRGRPGADARPPSSAKDDSPQKILMSLRTPSHSFEDDKKKDDPLSPEAPPKIHHSHHQNTSDLKFDPQKSPKSAAASGPPQLSSSIDMAPSFTLFNQSFDSIGDTANFFNVSGPLDSALRSSSFEAGPSASDEKTTELHLTSSTGNFSQQLLAGSTFEMSPSNSFGNGPPIRRNDSSELMMLGAPESRSLSPSQVLDMYKRSYSGGGPDPSPRSKGGPLEDSHLRMSGGSLTIPTRSYSYSQSYSEAPHYRGSGFGHPDSVDGGPGFYVFLKRHKGAFKECSFLLPGLKAVLMQEIDAKDDAAETPKRHTRPGDHYGEPNPLDISIAMRRVASAVCAFGGTFLGERGSQQAKSGGAQSIFREKPRDSATVTPNSSAGTSPGSHRARQRAKYDEMLPSRYYENDNRLSWEFEENPPIDDMGKDEEEADELKREEGEHDEDGDKDGDDEKNGDGDNEDESGDGTKTASDGKEGDQPKMRYRCKLCGQPKQNHTCPYQQSLARSIGTMVYPAVNAFTASEPGSLAPALAEMNNFISGGDSVSSEERGSPSRPTPDRMRRMNQGVPPGTAQVTPESLRGSPRVGSPMTTPQRVRTPASVRRIRPGLDLQRRYMGAPAGSPGSRGRKRGHGQMSGFEDQGDLLFVESVELKPEQFRIVTPSKIVTAPDAFTYPALPLPYAQRKRLSDNLFSLSKEVPQLTDECAAVLREAREKDMWDLAVAELMTQVVVVVHCHDGDSRFEGLRRYLMSLGIAC